MELIVSARKTFYTRRHNLRIEHKIRKPSGGNQGAFSNQKPLTIKPYLMIIAANIEDNDSKKYDVEIIDIG